MEKAIVIQISDLLEEDGMVLPMHPIRMMITTAPQMIPTRTGWGRIVHAEELANGNPDDPHSIKSASRVFEAGLQIKEQSGQFPGRSIDVRMM